ncbi:Hint domain-containing protein [Komagataeibacter swingsii]|uniref:Hint domain-containing protein n=1 Tax=Komagataeibacter swingsii TaxID=215220 RepID=A0A850P699_9PROT|nr:Hint domain-containing protein [Komagataeibacter swingsii]NVN38553.1 Hint domain-containing protein [Komagataeibacter swingsii]
MSTGLYSYGNTITTDGSYTLFPTVYLLGIASSGGGAVTFYGNITDSLSFAPALVGAINPYSVTSEGGANVTVNVGADLIGLLTGSTFTASGGTISIAGDNITGALSGTTYNINSGGTINIGTLSTSEISALSGTGIKFGNGGGTLVVTPATGVTILTFDNISGFGNAGSTIEIPGASYVTNATYDGSTTSITTNTGITINVNGDYTPSENSLYQTDNGGNLYISALPTNSTGTDGTLVCFLSGSMIKAPTGDVAVENIQIGDTIVTLDWQNNIEITRKVIWTGKAHARIHPNLPDDEAGYPVRILKNAIADGVPYKDMLITAEHCLFFEGNFVPVRMLVNGRSIFYDKSISHYTYYHIETEQHSVIQADGMLTESYLDTGNRQAFKQSGNVVRLGNTVQTWEDNSAVPLNVLPTFVEPLYRNIEARGEKLGFPISSQAAILSDDADLHLMTETGVIIRKMREANGYAFFMIPPGVETVHILSRTSRPSDTIGPYIDDRRELGVLIKDIKLFEGSIARPISTHLAEEAPAGWYDGWYAPANVPCRWTDGQATLHLGQRHPTLMGLLCLEILAGGPYVIKSSPISISLIA